MGGGREPSFCMLSTSPQSDSDPDGAIIVRLQASYHYPHKGAARTDRSVISLPLIQENCRTAY